MFPGGYVLGIERILEGNCLLGERTEAPSHSGAAAGGRSQQKETIPEPVYVRALSLKCVYDQMRSKPGSWSHHRLSCWSMSDAGLGGRSDAVARRYRAT